MIPGWKYIRAHRKTLALALGLATINQVFSLLDPLIFRFIIDDYATNIETIPPDAFLSGVLLLLAASVGVAFVSRTAKTFQEYYVSLITQKVGTTMYAHSVSHTFSLPYGVFEDRRSGEILQKLQKARTDTQGAIESFIGVLFLSAVGIIFVLGYAFTVHWMVGAAFVTMIPLLGGFTFIMSQRIKQAQKGIVTESAELAGSTTETLRNVELVKSMGLEHQEITRLNEVNERILGLELTKVKLVRTLAFIQGTTINLLRTGLLFLMLWLVFQGEITLGALFSLLFYSFFIFGPLSDLGRVAQAYQEAKASNEALDEVLSIPPEAKPARPILIPHIQTIEFQDVSFKYASSTIPSVNGASFKLNAGDVVAFAGASGSGKTTLAKLMVGLYTPSRGKILFNGKDSARVDFDSLRKRVGLVSQETQLFAGTIRENLLFVNPQATDEDCLRVLEQANIMGIVHRGDKGLDTKIGEGGIKISGGERQRLAIARALLRDPDLIIFDEATSSLDSISERAITHTIQEIKKKRPHLICVLIAHRLSTITHADTIFVLERGGIEEVGNHSQLVRKKGLYFAFWRQQSGEITSPVAEAETL
ncbi:MAG: ABC transporter ATP-binding protein [Candidatus Diapherotrites archaeon]|nr:ABC transporter ATP-binding protein [Candidatus Diapherotrites archaeon]MDZ4256614.1 ABC transporter ATP-binding protein [archaeon]